MQNYLDFIRSISTGKLKKVYFVCANDNYFINKASEILKQKLFGEVNSQTSYFVKYADETKYAELLDLLNNFSSIFTEQKLVIVKRCEKYSRSLEHIFAYSETPDNDTVAVFCFDRDYVLEKKMDRKYPFYDFSELPREFYLQWINEEFKRQNCKISDEDAIFFASNVPLIFDIMEHEIEKISNYIGDSDEKTVTKEMILKMTGFDRVHSPDDLLKAIAEKDKKRAVDVSEYLLNKAGVNEVYLLSIMSRYFLDLLSFKSPGMENKARGELYKLRFWGDSVEFARKYNRDFTHEQLSRIFELMLETDKKLKTTQTDTAALMNSLVEELVSIK